MNKVYEFDIEDAGQLRSVDIGKVYAVKGEELVAFSNRLDDIKSELNVIRYQIRDALGVLSGNRESLPCFVAKMGLILDVVAAAQGKASAVNVLGIGRTLSAVECRNAK